MFDRAPSSRRAKSWQPDPGLLSHSRGFATTRWGDSDDGFMVDDIKRTKDGFALDEYAQVPLSPQAVQALKRLQKMAPEEAAMNDIEVFEANEPFEVEAWNANAHLPFVVDDYGFDEDVVIQEPAVHPSHDPTVESVTLAQEPEATTAAPAQLEHDVDAGAEALDNPDPALNAKPHSDAEEQNEAEAMASAEVHTDAAQSAPEHEADTLEAGAGEAGANTNEIEATELSGAEVSEAESSEAELSESEVTEVTEVDAKAINESEANEQAEAKADSQVQDEAQEEAKEEAKEETQLQAQEDPESQPSLSEKTAPDGLKSDLAAEEVVAPEPVHAGIDPDVVAQHEAEKAEKFAEGLAQGMEKGLAQGVAQGESQAREAMQQEVQAKCTLLANVTQELQALLQDSKAFYEPMKRLALHVAEQIVMAELRTSTHAIEQLIQRCLDELDHPAQGLVVLELNPDDKARLQAQSPELIRGMRLEAVHDMAPGSVRLFANDAVVEDLVTHRLQALAQSMLVDVAAWQAHSALAKPAAAAHDMESDDVHP